MKNKAISTPLMLTVVASVGVLAVLSMKAFPDSWIRNAISRQVGAALEADSKNIRRRLDSIACDRTAVFVISHMSKTPSLPNKYALLDCSLQAVEDDSDGLYCEFGVYTGDTINYIAQRAPQHAIHGFDSFEGLPETWRTGFAEGAFTMAGLPRVRENVELHKGWFDQSLPVWAEAHPGPVAFLHLDADLYSSTKTVFDILGDRIVPGTVIQFDEYFNYPGWQEGEFKAFGEFVDSRRIEFEYLAYCDQHEQVSVRILQVGASHDQ
ncbi:MAG: class I SAM-dependent methyltransferase [Planctomycetes bacterium]|nr:class I SAM-dependent methyltransferase [Planctomycetota bacterium]